MSDIKYNPKQLKVLIVDDHDPIRKAMKKVVQSMGIVNIVEAFDGGQAIAELDKQHFDLILCDLYMRKISGFDVLVHLRGRQIANDIPFVVVTGEASKEDIVKSSDLGGSEYILKPFQAGSLEDKVKNVLNKYHSPTTVLRLLRSGDKLILEKNFELALTVFESAINLEEDNPRANHSIAVALLLMGREKVAMEKLTDNLREAPSYYKNYVTLANLHLKRKNPQDAIAALTSELDLHPKQAKRQAVLAKLLLKEGDINGSINHYREALKEDPKFKTALLGMGHAFAKSDDLEKALYYFKRLRRHHPKETKALEATVKYCLEANDPKKAEILLRDEKKRHPDRLDVYSVLTRFYVATDQDQLGLNTLEELFAIDEVNIEGLRIKGGLERKLGLLDQATETFSKLAKMEPSLEIYIAVGECSQKIGKHRKSIAALNRALILDSKNSKVVYLLAVSFMKTKQFAKAFNTFSQAKKFGFSPKHCDNNLSQCLRAIRARHKQSKLIAS